MADAPQKPLPKIPNTKPYDAGEIRPSSPKSDTSSSPKKQVSIIADSPRKNSTDEQNSLEKSTDPNRRPRFISIYNKILEAGGIEKVERKDLETEPAQIISIGSKEDVIIPGIKKIK